MPSTFSDKLRELVGLTCRVEARENVEDAPRNDVYAVDTLLHFSDEATLQALFWRLLDDRRPPVSIFDHRQRYGLPAPVDAIAVLGTALEGKRVSSAAMDQATGDLELVFEGGVKLEVFDFTGYEIWEMTFADGSREFSNFALGDDSRPLRPWP